MKAIEERSINGGIQKIYRFENHYGASVVKHNFSYGGKIGKWELAVIKFNSLDNFDFKLIYNTPITDDVIGYLDESEIDEILKNIKDL